jgi:SPX domain protein involved in polyphosphate accumulation
MGYANVFKRYETKYLITKSQYKQILAEISDEIDSDEYGKSTICNLYFDTPDNLLIRRSLEKPVYKEKLRLRSYGIANDNSTTFVEIKKKYQDVVYKRRESLTESDAMKYLCQGKFVKDSQIMREIDYFLSYYKDLAPAVFISYEREAFYAKEDSDFRITFDKNILWRDYDLSLKKGIYGNPIMKQEQVLMEIKTPFAYPLWMVRVLSENHIYKTSFSKYGNAYKQKIMNRQHGGCHYA